MACDRVPRRIGQSHQRAEWNPYLRIVWRRTAGARTAPDSRGRDVWSDELQAAVRNSGADFSSRHRPLAYLRSRLSNSALVGGPVTRDVWRTDLAGLFQ